MARKRKGFDSRGMPLYEKPKVRKGKGLYGGIPGRGLLDPSLRRDIGDIPDLAPTGRQRGKRASGHMIAAGRALAPNVYRSIESKPVEKKD